MELGLTAAGPPLSPTFSEITFWLVAVQLRHLQYHPIFLLTLFGFFWRLKFHWSVPLVPLTDFTVRFFILFLQFFLIFYLYIQTNSNTNIQLCLFQLRVELAARRGTLAVSLLP